MLLPPPAPCCDLGSDKHHPFTGTAAYTYTDRLGFTYALCAKHYAALVVVLARARAPGYRPVSRGGYAHREYRRRCPG